MSSLNDHLQTESTTLSSLTIGLVIASSLLGLIVLLFCIYYFKKRNQTVPTKDVKRSNLRKGWPFFISPSLLFSKKISKEKKPTVVTTILDDIPLPKPTLSKSSLNNNKSLYYYSTLNHQHPLSSSTIYSSINASTITPSYYEEEGYDPKILYHYNQSSTFSLKKNQHHYHQQYHPNLTMDPLLLTTTMTSTTLKNNDYIKDPTILQSLERQRHENDFYYKGTLSSNIYQHPAFSSTSVLSHPPYHHSNNNNHNDSSLNNILLSSFISLPPTTRPSNDQDHQEKSNTYHVW
ncbi:unnamed protein product [Cunninghamella blakesleeana]